MADLGRVFSRMDWDPVTLTGLACPLQHVVVWMLLHGLLAPSIEYTAIGVISNLNEVSQESPVFLLSHVAYQPLPCHVHVVLEFNMHL